MVFPYARIRAVVRTTLPHTDRLLRSLCSAKRHVKDGWGAEEKRKGKGKKKKSGTSAAGSHIIIIIIIIPCDVLCKTQVYIVPYKNQQKRHSFQPISF
jgi:hypothetical protein